MGGGTKGPSVCTSITNDGNSVNKMSDLHLQVLELQAMIAEEHSRHEQQMQSLYQELSQQRSAMQQQLDAIETAESTISSLRKDIAELHEAHDDLTLQLDSASGCIAALQDELTSVKQSHNTVSKELQASNDELLNIQMQLKQSVAEQQGLSGMLASAVAATYTVQQQLIASNQRVEELRQRLSCSEQDKEEQTASLSNAEAANANAHLVYELELLRGKLVLAEDVASGLRQQIKDCSARENAAREDAAAHKAALAAAGTRNADLQVPTVTCSNKAQPQYVGLVERVKAI